MGRVDEIRLGYSVKGIGFEGVGLLNWKGEGKDGLEIKLRRVDLGKYWADC